MTLFFLLFFTSLLFLFLIIFLFSNIISEIFGAPYVPISKKSIKKILALVDLKKEDAFFDLGSGDGRVLIEAVRNFDIKKAIGYEIGLWQYWKSKFLINYAGLKDRIKIFNKNFLKADLSGARVIFLYLYPKLVQRLALKFSQELKPGTKIISVSFKIEEPKKFALELLKIEKIDRFTVYLYQKI